MSGYLTRRSGADLAALCGIGALAALLAGDVIDRDRPAAVALAILLVLAAATVSAVSSFGRLERRTHLFAISPLVPATVTWLALFVFRPLELFFAADHAAVGLARLGFDVGQLTRTVAIAAVGVAAWSVGYLVALGHKPVAGRIRDEVPRKFSVSAAAALLALGTLLWIVLFQRQGGLDTLMHSAVAIRSDQRSSFWAFVGVWIVQSVGLYALLVSLEGGTRGSRLIVAAAGASAAFAAVATQLRMFAAFAFVSGVVLVIALRRLRPVHVLTGLAVASLGMLALGFGQQVRAYTHVVDTPEAFHLAAETPMWASYVSDLSTFDHFVAMQQLAPSSIGYLDGRTLAEIPQALVPRSMWPDKPLGVDFEVGAYLYPGADAGIPISAQGELYWNGGIPLVGLGCLVLGLLCAGLVRLCLTRGRLALLAYALVLPFTHALLTRGFATMFQNLVFALTGLAIVIVVLDRETRAQLIARAVPAVKGRVLLAGARRG